MFFFSKTSRPPLWLTQSAINGRQGFFSLGVKRPQPDFNHTSLCTEESEIHEALYFLHRTSLRLALRQLYFYIENDRF